MKTNIPNTRGFIPLIAIILLGLAAIAVAISIRHDKPTEALAAAESAILPTVGSTSPSAPVSAPVGAAHSQTIITPSVAKQKPSTSVKQPEPVPSAVQETVAPQVVSTPSSPIQEPAPVAVNPYKDSLDAIDAFLANQTPSALMNLCVQSKQLPGTGSHEGLSGDKTTVTQIQNSLYANISPCETVLGRSIATRPNEKYPFAWFAYSDSYILPPQTSSSDSDAMRITIIKDTDKYNEKMKSLAGYKMIYFASFSGLIPKEADVFQNIRPDDVAKTLLERIRTAHGSQRDFNNFLSSFVPLEQMLVGLKAEMAK